MILPAIAVGTIGACAFGLAEPVAIAIGSKRTVNKTTSTPLPKELQVPLEALSVLARPQRAVDSVQGSFERVHV